MTNRDEFQNVNDDFETELRQLVPWTPPVLVLHRKTDLPSQKPTSRRALAGTLLVGLFLGTILGGALVSRILPPRTEIREVVRDTKVVPPVQLPLVKEHDPPSSVRFPDEIQRDSEAFIDPDWQRLRNIARISRAVSASGSGRTEKPRIPDDPLSIFRLRESPEI